MDDGTETEDLSVLPFEGAQIEEFCDQGLGYVFVFADFLFIYPEDGFIVLAGGSGESHGFQAEAFHGEQEFGGGACEAIISLYPSI